MDETAQLIEDAVTSGLYSRDDREIIEWVHLVNQQRQRIFKEKLACHLNSGQWDAAIKLIEAAISTRIYKQENKEIIEGLSVIKQKKRKEFEKKYLSIQNSEQWEEATQIVEEAIVSGLFSQDDKEITEKISFINIQKELLPLYNVALLDIKEGRSKDAAFNLRKIVDIDPGYKDALAILLKFYKSIDVFSIQAQLESLESENKSLISRMEYLLQQLEMANAGISSLSKRVPARTKQTPWDKTLEARFQKPPDSADAMVDLNLTNTLATSPVLETPPYLEHHVSLYLLGDDQFDDSYSIESFDGEFLGKFGVGIYEVINDGNPKKVIAFEVWLFDKDGIQTVTKLMLSRYANNDPVIHAKLEAQWKKWSSSDFDKVDLVIMESQKQFLLETKTLQLMVSVIDLQYSERSSPTLSYFDRVTFELTVMQRKK